MPERADRIERFLSSAGLADAARTPIAGDASGRRYWRLAEPAAGSTAVLMDAGPDAADETRRFVRIATHLRSLGLSAPEILADGADDGLLLVEDLGTGMFDAIAQRTADRVGVLYDAAIDALVRIQSHPCPDGLPGPDADALAAMIEPAFTWYRDRLCDGGATGRRDAILDALATAIDRHAGGARVLSLRDFHAGNLVWIAHRTGAARVGLLDFQDAFRAHPAYDVVSLLRDVRRDVPVTVQRAASRRFSEAKGLCLHDLEQTSAVLAVQRNLRILGVFARLALRDGKRGYLGHLPRVWSLLMEDLGHPSLDRLRHLVTAEFSAPRAVEGRIA